VETAREQSEARAGVRNSSKAKLDAYLWAVGTLSLAAVAWLAVRDWEDISGQVFVTIAWILIACISDLFAVRLGGSVTLSMSLPVTLAASLVLSPGHAALVAFLGCLDMRELRRETPVNQVLFNRGQVACATAIAATLVSAASGSPLHWPSILVLAVLALASDFAVNVALMVPALSLRDATSASSAFRMMFGSRAIQTALLYLSLGLIAPITASLYLIAGAWGLAASLVPVWLARASLQSVENLHGAIGRLASKDVAIRESTQRLADERRDERRTLAGELHDQVLPALFKVHLLGQVLMRDLESGRLLEMEEDLPELLEATSQAQLAVREVVGNLRRSDVGANGLKASLKSLVHQLEVAGAQEIVLDAEEVVGTERAQLVVYQVAREAMLNASRYSKSPSIQVRLRSEEGVLRISVSDNGIGFDPSHAPSNHFGLQLMRERVEAVGGCFTLDARLGSGVVVTASVPPHA
jgi:signal transduction histidine kinase